MIFNATRPRPRVPCIYATVRESQISLRFALRSLVFQTDSRVFGFPIQYNGEFEILDKIVKKRKVKISKFKVVL